jgi:RNA polymerase sigma-70 factor (ECF subfamily)
MHAERAQGRAEEEGDDTTLVRRVLSGDEAAFEVLVRRYQRLVFHVAGGFFRSAADVEEVAQETFLRAFRGLAGFRQEGPLAPWLARIAATSSVDRLRRRRAGSEVGWDDLPEGERRAATAMASGGDVADSVAARDLAERALGRLRPLDRAMVVLVDGQGFTPAEAAGMLGSTALAARVRLHRARRALRQQALALLGGDQAGAGEVER